MPNKPEIPDDGSTLSIMGFRVEGSNPSTGSIFVCIGGMEDVDMRNNQRNFMSSPWENRLRF